MENFKVIDNLKVSFYCGVGGNLCGFDRFSHRQIWVLADERSTLHAHTRARESQQQNRNSQKHEEF